MSNSVWARSLLGVIILFSAIHNRPQGQVKNPLAGGVWDRYSFRNAQGVEAGAPGWLFLTFTDDGQFFLIGVPEASRKLLKPLAEMSKDELVTHFKDVQVRRGHYTLTGNGPYKLVLTDEQGLLNPNFQGSCPASAPCEVRIENGEVRLSTQPNGTGAQARWRRVK